ncbi:YHYH domain-containing protein [Monaibacterium sp. h42]|uniref:YHYH domain-containing protein n=1 Tax=Pontivivens nitratireducens TaxID=2758038 RepID=UPI00163B0221
MRIIAAITLTILSFATPGFAKTTEAPTVATELQHGGGLNRAGCHNDRKAGTYHCH